MNVLLDLFDTQIQNKVGKQSQVAFDVIFDYRGLKYALQTVLLVLSTNAQTCYKIISMSNTFAVVFFFCIQDFQGLFLGAVNSQKC